MSRYEEVQVAVRKEPRTWLVTGAAGFIGSNLVEALLSNRQKVVGVDNFSTGFRANLDDVEVRVGSAWENFRFVEGDVRDLQTCRAAADSVDVILHQAALGSVPRSVKDPIASHQSNVDGFINMLKAATDAGVDRFVYASSSSVYGDHPALPKTENIIGKPLSPYAATKLVNEIYAAAWATTYGLQTVGLRYFNVFGRRQDPEGPYAAVIPRWVTTLLRGEQCFIFGDGMTTRDFCYIDNVVQANLLAGTAPGIAATGAIFNIAVGGRTTLNELFVQIRDGLQERMHQIQYPEPEYRGFRPGDVRHSQADVSKAREKLGYEPSFDLGSGLDAVLDWYVASSLDPAASK